MSPTNTNLARLQAWADARRKEGELEELAFCPGYDMDSSLDDVAWVAMHVIEHFDSGTEPRE